MRRFLIAAGALTIFAAVPGLGQPPEAAEESIRSSDYVLTHSPDRFSTFVSRNRRGNTVSIDHEKLIRFCGDEDGCSLRIGMHNWDSNGRVASRELLFFYNRRSGVWRSSLGDVAGTDSDNVSAHPVHAWGCYMTDGVYVDGANRGDSARGFSLMSSRQYNGDCWLTIID